jgi:hypothetical protein
MTAGQYAINDRVNWATGEMDLIDKHASGRGATTADKTNIFINRAKGKTEYTPTPKPFAMA